VPGVDPLLLEVAVHAAHDVGGAVEGGADRLSLETPKPGYDGSPDLSAASAVLRESDVPVRIMLRLNDTFSTTGGELSRLVGLGEEYLALGAQGVVFGFLDSRLEVDVETCRALADALPGVPWTFHGAIDAALDSTHAWRDVLSLAGLTAVRAGGSSRGLAFGYEELLARCQESPEVARIVMPAAGLVAEQVPWFSRAGVRQFHLGPQARPGGSAKAWVDPAYVRSWRRLLDDL
jgi:copper homeostasis protein